MVGNSWGPREFLGVLEGCIKFKLDGLVKITTGDNPDLRRFDLLVVGFPHIREGKRLQASFDAVFNPATHRKETPAPTGVSGL